MKQFKLETGVPKGILHDSGRSRIEFFIIAGWPPGDTALRVYAEFCWISNNTDSFCAHTLNDDRPAIPGADSKESDLRTRAK